MTMIASRSRRSRVAIAVWALLQSGAAPGSAAEGASGAAAEKFAAPSVSTFHEGYRRYQAVCAHCHGPDGAGSTFAPALVDRPIDLDWFRTVVLEGRINGNSVMKGFADDPNVVPYVDDIYAYLRARAEGVLGRGRPADSGPAGGGVEPAH
jgi:mono/diheme cytochrome c family protein